MMAPKELDHTIDTPTLLAQEESMRALLDNAVSMPPATLIGASVRTGVNTQLVHDDVVTTAEFLCLVPGPDGEELSVVFPLIMNPELAENLGLEDTPQETV